MATLDKFGVPIPSGSRRVMGQPKAKNRFRVVLYGFGADHEWGDAGASICYETNTVDLPKFNVATHELHQFDGITNIAGKMRWQDMTLTVKDTIDNQPAQAVVQQIQRHRDFNRRMAPGMVSGGYKFEMWIQTLTGEEDVSSALETAAGFVDAALDLRAKYEAGASIGDAFSSGIEPELLSGTIDTWICTGCMISDVDFGDKDYSDSNFNTISLTIKPDNCVCIDSTGKPLMYAPSSFNLASAVGGAVVAGGVSAFLGGDPTAVGSSMMDSFTGGL